MYMKITKALTVMFVSGVFLLGCSNPEEESINSPEITLQEFNQLSKGMSYEEVVEIVGSEGKPTSDPEDENSKAFVWDGVVSESFANISFKKDKLITKIQFDLK